MRIYCKILVKYFLHLLLLPLRFFSVKNYRITLLNDLGGYADSPRCVCEHLRALFFTSKTLEIYFACTPPFPIISGVKFIKKNSLSFFVKALTSRVFLTNNGSVSFLPFSRKTTVINTWHGGGGCKRIVPVSNRTFGVFWDRDMSANKTHIFLSSCKTFTHGAVEDHLANKSSIYEIGLPKNDIFFDLPQVGKIKKKVRQELNIPTNTYLVLYAPTFRNNIKDNVPDCYLKACDISLVLRALEKRTQRNWLFGYRLHRLTKQHLSASTFIDLQNYPDVQNLLCATDILITDYSSVAWDFSLTLRPIFLFAPDHRQYEKDIGFYMPFAQWPFPVAENIDELVSNILKLDKEDYISKIHNYHSTVGSYEHGYASQLITIKIMSLLSQSI